MFLLEFFQRCKGGHNFGVLHLAKSWKQRLLFVSCVFRSSLAEVAQGRFERPSKVLGQRVIDYFRDCPERAEKHLDPAVAVRQQAAWIGEVVGFCSNLNWHILS